MYCWFPQSQRSCSSPLITPQANTVPRFLSNFPEQIRECYKWSDNKAMDPMRESLFSIALYIKIKNRRMGVGYGSIKITLISSIG